MHTKPGRLEESQSERVERLATCEPQQLQSKRHQLRKDYLSQYDFKPRINRSSWLHEKYEILDGSLQTLKCFRISRTLGRAQPVDELLANEKSKARRARAKEEANRKLNEECPFKPNVNSRSSSRMITNMIGNTRWGTPHLLYVQFQKHLSRQYIYSGTTN
jgi:hypothetical protein